MHIHIYMYIYIHIYIIRKCQLATQFYIELQCAAFCCHVLQCAAVCCSVLHFVAMCCSVLQYVAVCCILLPCVAVCCSMLQCAAMCCATVAHSQKSAHPLHFYNPTIELIFGYLQQWKSSEKKGSWKPYKSTLSGELSQKSASFSIYYVK